jgi:hypothetical protein
VPRFHIGSQPRVPRVDEQQHHPRPRASEVGVGERLKLRRGLVAASLSGPRARRPGVPVPGQVYEIPGLARSPFHSIDVDEPSLAGLGARPCDGPIGQGVDQARLAYVRSSDKRNLRQPVAGKVARTRRARDELCDNSRAQGSGLGPQGWARLEASVV